MFLLVLLYSVIKKDGLNFIRLYFSELYMLCKTKVMRISRQSFPVNL